MAKFKPGETGNPKGRPVGLERRLKEQIGDNVPALIDALLSIALGDLDEVTGRRGPPTEEAKTRVTAIRELLDRLMGKPRQSLEVSSDGPAMLLEALGLTAAQRARRAAELEERNRESPSLPEADDAEIWPDS